MTDTTPDPIRIAAILGSVTRPGRLHRALREALDRVPGADASIELFDLGQLRIAFADGRPPAELGDDTERVVGAIADADAVVLATPIYRGSLTGALKNLIDQIPIPALRDTPVAIVAMGGSDHHYLGADRHLRDVLQFFGALALPTAVYLSSRDFDDGVPGERAADQLDELLRATVVLARERAGGPTLGPAPLAAPRA